MLAFEPGQTILDVASANGIAIPTLCYLPEAGHRDVCRLCVVEVAGAGRLLPACSTPATEGMDVQSMSDRVRSSRRSTLELIIGSGRHTCITCESLGECELSRLAYEYQVEPPSELPGAEEFPLIEDAYVIRDYSKCILCGRCWAACTAIQVHGIVPHPSGRRAERAGGKDWYPLPDLDQCELCGQCVDACPVGALTERTAKGVARHWELQRVRTTCPHCGMGCQTVVHLKDGDVVKVTGAGDVPPNRGRLCKRGRFAVLEPDERVRLEEPLVRKGGVLVKASWDEALDLVAEKLGAAGDVAGLIAPVCTNEEAYQAQKFFRAVLGTNDLDHRRRRGVEGLAGERGDGRRRLLHLRRLDGARGGPRRPRGRRRRRGRPPGGRHRAPPRRARRRAPHGARLRPQRPRRGPPQCASPPNRRRLPEVLNGIIAVLLANELAGRRDAGETGPHERELEAMLAAVLPERIAEDAGVDAATIRAIAGKLVDVRAGRRLRHARRRRRPRRHRRRRRQAAVAARRPRRRPQRLAAARRRERPGPRGHGSRPGHAAGRRPRDRRGGAAAAGRRLGRRLAAGRARPLHSRRTSPGSATARCPRPGSGPTRPPRSATPPVAGGARQGRGSSSSRAPCAATSPRSPTWSCRRSPGARRTVRSPTRSGGISRLRRVQRPPGAARPGWWAFREVAERLGHEWQAGYPKAVWEDEISLLIPSLGGVTYAEIEEFGLCWPAPAPVTA